jgi:glycosyltransferase involved in cell wall biosynthesis
MRSAMSTTRGSNAIPDQPSTPEPSPPVRVSIVTIFLNAEQYLTESIESVLAQDFRNFELILVDDGSTDGSTALALAYADRYQQQIRYLEHQGHVNRGMSASRNLGVNAARGDLIALMDADDVWRPSKLSEQVAVVDAHPEVAMVCGAARYWESWAGGEDRIVRSGHIQNTVVPAPEAAIKVYPLGTAPAPCPSDLLVRRSLVLALGGFEEHFTGVRQLYEDQGFLIKVYLAAPVYFSDRHWLDYRVHPESCVASVSAAGHYDEVRSYFLDWLEGYVAELPPAHPVLKALRRAQRRYRHPLRHRLLTLPAAAIAKAARTVRRFASATRHLWHVES